MAAGPGVKYSDVTERSGWCTEHFLSHLVTIRVYHIHESGVKFLAELTRCLT